MNIELTSLNSPPLPTESASTESSDVSCKGKVKRKKNCRKSTCCSRPLLRHTRDIERQSTSTNSTGDVSVTSRIRDFFENHPCMAWVLLCTGAILFGAIIGLILRRVNSTESSSPSRQPIQSTVRPTITPYSKVTKSNEPTTTSAFTLKYSSTRASTTKGITPPTIPPYMRAMNHVSSSRINKTLMALDGLASNQTGSATCYLLNDDGSGGLRMKRNIYEYEEASGEEASGFATEGSGITNSNENQFEYSYDYEEDEDLFGLSDITSPGKFFNRTTQIDNRYVLSKGFDRTVAFLSESIGNLSLPVVSQSFNFTSFDYKCSSKNIFTGLRGSSNQTIVIGAHCDSVFDGKGVNDNGSGVAVVLEALKVIRESGLELMHSIVFAFWGAEEVGLAGSNSFMQSPDKESILSNITGASSPNITCYLNLETVGSLNGGFFISNSSESSPPDGYARLGSPYRSDILTELLGEAFSQLGLTTQPKTLIDDSDHTAFVSAGIPVVTVTSGTGSLIKSEAESQLFGGTAGDRYDNCYHESCDDIGNVSVDRVVNCTKAIVNLLTRLATRKDIFGSN